MNNPPQEPSRERYAHPLPRYFAATRPAFLSAALLAALLGLAAASHDGVPLTAWMAGLTVCAALCAHAGANVLNDYYDAFLAAGKLHWVARLPVRRARWGYLLIAGMAYVWLLLQVWRGGLPPLALLGLLAAPLSGLAAWQLLCHAEKPQHLAAAIRLTIAALMVHGLALICGLSWG